MCNVHHVTQVFSIFLEDKALHKAQESSLYTLVEHITTFKIVVRITGLNATCAFMIMYCLFTRKKQMLGQVKTEGYQFLWS